NTPQQMQRLFDGVAAAKGTSTNRYTVYYYRDRSEFIAALKQRQPGIEVANGVYMPNDRVAYFFYQPEDEEDALGTVFHEVTHQLLGESSGRPIAVAELSDFWVIEGIACYMESFQLADEAIHVGDPKHIRMYWARTKAV